jgi:probable HAF family extracellular repeat protein
MRTTLFSIPFALVACSVADPSDEALVMPAATVHAPPGRALAGAHRHYTLEALPTGVPGGTSQASKAICAGDGIVGSASITAFLDVRPVLYADGVVTDLGTPAGRVGQAYDGNALGEIVGAAAIAGPTPGTAIGNGQAFLYRDGALMVLPGIGGESSQAFAINEREVIVGEAAIPGSGDVPNHAVVWENCVPTDLGTLGGTDSFARGINDADVIVGTAIDDAGRAHAVVWRDKVIEDLGLDDAHDTQAYDINASGTVAGFTQRPDRAVIWSGGAMTTLPTLGGQHAFALGLDDRGEVVGASTDATETRFHAFLYADGSTIALEPLVDAPGWQLLEARDICDDGRIVGNGIVGGVVRGFILTPD